MEIYLARTQGFCSGVANAIRIVNQALQKYGAPLYVYHEIVHNTFVVEDFRKKGVVFVETLEQVPPGATLIFSAHGVPPAVIQAAAEKGVNGIDASCPLVKKVHEEAKRFSNEGYQVVLIGHKGHQEIFGTSGYVKASALHVISKKSDIGQLNIQPNEKVAYLTQTTLSMDETEDLIAGLKKKYPQLIGPKNADICYATQQRQDAVKELARFCDMIIVCGSPTSSNSNRLRETGEKQGVASFIIDSVKELDFRLLEGKKKIGISSGASVPPFIVDELVEGICERFPGTRVMR